MSIKITFLAAALCCMLSVYAQTDNKKGPVISFKETDFNFGIFDQEHGLQSHYFVFTNTGDEDLVITEAHASCNCTVPEYPRTAVAPGASDSIKVSYNGTSRRPGVFRKIITVNYNAKNAKDSMAMVTITGEMVGKKVAEQLSKDIQTADKPESVH